MRNRGWWLIGAGLWALALAAGCLERKETIKVARDGGVTIEVEYSGKAEQFETADALPSQAAGWPVRKTVKREPVRQGIKDQLLDGSKFEGRAATEEAETVTLTAERRFEPREELPGNFAAPGDADARLYTQFPTEIRVERRPDGVYLHFRRTYLPRPWAYVEYWRDQLIDDDVKKLSDKPVEEMTADEKIKLVRASAGIEFYKQIELARLALEALTQGERGNGTLTPALSARGDAWARGRGDMEARTNVPQDAWLRARAAMVALAEETDWEGLIARLVNVPEEARADAFEADSEKLLDATYSTLVQELSRAANWDDSQAQAFAAAYEREEKRYNITNDLGAHGFKIRVEMPGEIVAHNGDKEDNGAVEWEFSGDAFRDRPYELMVTAKVAGTRD